MVWGSDLILLQWCSSTFAPVGSTYESARDANMSPGSSGGSKFTLPLQVNFCAFTMEIFAPLQMQKDGGRIRGAVVVHKYGHVVSLSERTADKWE